ncbi:MAG TPA: HAMP domain-containing sensor histidine kinase, partial [Longimicrobiales bacterium]|nr:HAMP domain-containing sensor histidine kinase [Longimicrobiales bacterium]
MSLLAPSFRSRIMLVVLTVAVVPMALIGLWLTRSASRSGQELLRSRLDDALDGTVTRIGRNWLLLRSDLLFLGDDRDVQRALIAESARPREAPADLRRRFRDLDASVAAATIRDSDGRELWRLTRAGDEGDAGRDAGPTLRVALPIHQRFPARELGTLEVDLELVALLGNAGTSASVAGLVLGAVDAARDAPLLPLPFDPALLDRTTFSWGGDAWLTARRRMRDPPLILSAAAPLSAFAGPFEAASRRGTWLLSAVALAGLIAAWLLTRRLTRSLERLVTAAEAVSQGDLEARVESAGTDEVGRVAHAFNTMTASLRRTLAELADRERLAAVGEFAASLAHEVRNPLTAIRIDLQRVEERLPADSPLRAPQARALKEISRLDATVSETLDVARAGRWRTALVDLATPIRAAADAAAPAFAKREAILDLSGLVQAQVRGDPAALEQLFLNLLLNAAAALGPGGRAWIELAQQPDQTIVAVRDNGTGIPAEMIDRIFQPLYTTRPDGTGLGLTVARRIVDQHGGQIEIESREG